MLKARLALRLPPLGELDVVVIALLGYLSLFMFVYCPDNRQTKKYDDDEKQYIHRLHDSKKRGDTLDASPANYFLTVVTGLGSLLGQFR